MHARVVFAWLLHAACVGAIDEGSPEPQLDDELAAEIAAAVPSYREFARINRKPFASAIGEFEVNVFVNASEEAYAQIHPESSGSLVSMPVGALIVREVLDDRRRVEKLTLMAKGPPGSSPAIGDWLFGLADPSGGSVELGVMTECHGCHLPRETDDYLFGVAANRER